MTAPTTPAAAADLAALLGSRICHDLISPLGAISNGVELLEMAGGAAGPEIGLISESVENANARIRFFRVAFGAAAPDQTMGAAEITAILDDLARGGRLVFDWRVPGDVPRPEVKLAFLMLQCFETAMPWGGRVAVTRENARWTLAGEAERTKIDPDLWETLSRPDTARTVSAAEVHFLLLPILLQAETRRLSLDIAETAITARF